MTTLEPATTMLPAWLRPVLATVDDETMEQSRSWVVALADADDVYIEELARAAFGRAPDELIRSLEGRLAAVAPTYAPEGKAELIAHLAAASLLHMVDGRGDLAVDITGRCESLLFLGWAPAIPDLPARLRAFSQSHSHAARERVPLGGTLKAPRKKTAEDPNADEIARLNTSLTETQGLLARAVDRIETVVEQFNNRLALLDEEVDALWWARADRSATTGQAWSDLDTLQRAVLAGVEVAAIVGTHPPTAGTLTVMNQVIGDSTETYRLIEVVDELQKAGWSRPAPEDDDGGPFRPLSAGIALMRRFDDDLTVVAAALKSSLSVPDGHEVTASAVAYQLLNENALQDDDD